MNSEIVKQSDKCAFIIVTYNSVNDIQECINSIKEFHPECGIYVVDNNSSDGTSELLSSIRDINLTLLPVNSGFSGGNNYAIKKALSDNYEYVFLFNPDSRLTSKIIDSLINLSSTKKCLVGPVIYNFDAKTIQSVGGKYNPLFSHFRVDQNFSTDNNYKKVDWILGASLFISKNIIQKCGYFDEGFFPASLEESSYCIEARKKGVNSFIDLNSSVLHKGATSSGGSKNYLLRIIKNRYYYAMTYQNLFFFFTTIIESTLRYTYHKIFGILKK